MLLSVVRVVYAALFVFLGIGLLINMARFDVLVSALLPLSWTIIPYASKLVIGVLLMAGLSCLFTFRKQPHVIWKVFLNWLPAFVLIALVALDLLNPHNTPNLVEVATNLGGAPFSLSVFLLPGAFLLFVPFRWMAIPIWLLVALRMVAMILPFLLYMEPAILWKIPDNELVESELKAEMIAELPVTSQSKQVWVLLSSKCSHCMDLAHKLDIMESRGLNVDAAYIVVGSQSERNRFILQAGIADRNIIPVDQQKAIRLADGAYPSVIWIDNNKPIFQLHGLMINYYVLSALDFPFR